MHLTTRFSPRQPVIHIHRPDHRFVVNNIVIRVDEDGAVHTRYGLESVDGESGYGRTWFIFTDDLKPVDAPPPESDTILTGVDERGREKFIVGFHGIFPTADDEWFVLFNGKDFKVLDEAINVCMEDMLCTR